MTTTVSGVVYAPNGTLPLYNVVVYVPSAPLDPLPLGVSCDRCGNVSGKPIASTVTAVDGRFVLKNVPVGKNIPLVVQVGKWRRQITIENVAACVDNPIVDPELTRLPKNRAEGDLPRIAVTTGRCDQLACLLPKLGIDASEYTSADEDGHLHLYRGAGHNETSSTWAPIAAPAPSGTYDATVLWNSFDSLKYYDIVLMSCECGVHNENKSAGAKKAIYDFTAAGGRVFASHFHYTWAQIEPLKSTADWILDPGERVAMPPFFVDTSFPKGAALADWLVEVGATRRKGEMPISQPRESIRASFAGAQRWVYSETFEGPPLDATRDESPKYLSINSPIGRPAKEQCGKFVFADMHLWGGDIQAAGSAAIPNDQFPATCSRELTPEERALAFLFFDLSSCIQDDAKPPEPPPVH